MCVHKRIKTSISLIFAVLPVLCVFIACDAMDSLLISAETYKINARAGNMPIDDLSFLYLNDQIIPFFEEPVYNDPDITSLVIHLKDTNDSINNWSIVYSLANETEEYASKIIVKNFDDNLPPFKLPANLSKGVYTIVFEVKSGKDTLQRTEKEFYYLGNTLFSFSGIDVHLPGISDNPYLVSGGQVILLESKLEFESSLDPYIVWYSGKNKIAEGVYSEGASQLFWKAPEMSNFYSLRAEVFPAGNFKRLAGYQKEVSILVSNRMSGIHLVSEDDPQLKNWYVFEANVIDSKTSALPLGASVSGFFRPAEDAGILNNTAYWKPSGGTYGLATGYENNFLLPKNRLTANDSWQLLFRFKALEYGNILTVNFEPVSVSLSLNVYENHVELILNSDLQKASYVYDIAVNKELFTVMGVNFFTEYNPQNGIRRIGAGINIFGEIVSQDAVYLDLGNSIVNEFQICLGHLLKEESNDKYDDNQDIIDITIDEIPVVSKEAAHNALWDEFALYNRPFLDLIAKDIVSIYE